MKRQTQTEVSKLQVAFTDRRISVALARLAAVPVFLGLFFSRFSFLCLYFGVAGRAFSTA
jgi:hypothetical protein